MFDFDGLLVNTEELHFGAYKKMCTSRGFDLGWSFHRYCLAAHLSATGLREQIYAEFPLLYEQEPNWEILYKEKKRAYMDLLNEGASQLMPGASRMLEILDSAQIRCCVVTHSPLEQVDLIRTQNPQLNVIPHWITREQYSQPKPHSDSYLKAIELLASPSDQVIGFEDTPRGLKALQGTRAQPVFVSGQEYPIPQEVLKDKHTLHFSSLNDLINK